MIIRLYCIIIHGPDRVTVHPPPPPPRTVWDQVFLLLGPLPISRVDAIKKKLGCTTCFGLFSKWPPSKSRNHVLCHNLSYKAVRVIQLVSIHMYLGARSSIIPIKNVSVLSKIYKQLFKRIFRAFSVIFCVSPWATEGYCAPSTHESLIPSFSCSQDLLNIKSRCHQIKVAWTTCFRPFQNGRHWNLESRLVP